MQLKNNNPVAMEKRTDLASLFCMIGHHGPAVAVAVIAMVSVVAGFIIYRTVKGKRRKAEAGPGDLGSCSPGEMRDTSLLQPEKEPSTESEAHRLVESTDLGEEDLKAKDADVNLNLGNLRNRRVAAEKNNQSCLPGREVKPEILSSASHAEKKSTVPLKNAEEATKSLQDDPCEVKDLNMEPGCNLTETTNDADKSQSCCLEPIVTLKALGNEKVQGMTEDEMANEDMSNEMPCQEENQCGLNKPVCHEEKAWNGNDEKGNEAVSKSISSECCLKEPSIQMHKSPLPTNLDDTSVVDIPSLNKPHPAHDLSENTGQQKQGDDQPLIVKSLTMLVTRNANAEMGPLRAVAENKLSSVEELSVGSDVLISEKQELEQDLSNCSKENINQSSLIETKETSSLVFSPNLPYLSSVEPEIPQDEHQTLPLVDLKPEDKSKDYVTPKLAEKNNSHLPLTNVCPQSENEMVNENLILEENAEMQSSADGDPDAVIDEVSSAESVSTEISCPCDSTFDKQTEQMRNVDLDVPTTLTPVTTESVDTQVYKDQLLDEQQIKLSWCPPDVGDESGVSSMTISPDLPDNECPLTSENLLDIGDRSQSKGQAEHVVPDSSNDSQTLVYYTEAIDDHCTINECHEMVSLRSEVDQISKDLPSLYASEDLEKMKTKIVIEDKQDEGEEEEKTTEINIMEATMDNNEWITDGTDQVLPCMKPSVPQINPESVERIPPFSLDTCSNADVSHVGVAEEANACTPTDKLIESGKRVLAVQPMPQNVSVTFQTHYLTYTPYQKVAVTGNNQELGNWKNFIPLEKAKDGLWTTVVSLPAESHVEWKFIVVDQGEVCRWEECGNRFLDTGNGENLLVRKSWGFM